MKKIKNIALAMFVALSATNTLAQDPVSVAVRIEMQSDTEAKLLFEAEIQEGWHVYSVEAGEGPIAAEITIEDALNCSTVGSFVAEGNEIEIYDEMFGSTVRYHEKHVVFAQAIKITNPDFHIAGYMTYGACNDESCTPPTAVNFSFGKPSENTAVAPTTLELKPIDFAAAQNSLEAITNHAELWQPANYEAKEMPSTTASLWLVFWSCFASGLLALLTPCVWPIIPMTVSFFLKRSQSRRKSIADASTYGLSIVVIYLILGLLVTLIFDANQLNALATNAVVNIFFTLLLIAFGVSFLGAFELQLPSSWSTAVNIKASKTSGLLSIFLMAFTLVLVSFSCTGPIIGLLLVQISTLGSIAAPAVGMLGFSVALALPFSLFALFPSVLNQLPRSGSWMNTLKVILGFVEIAFALKFFSVADLAYGWHLLDREVFVALWAALAFALALYLFGIIRFQHDDNSHTCSALRCMMGTVSLAFALYLLPGLWGAPLKAVSAFVPPLSTQDFSLYQAMPRAKYHDYEEALQKAQSSGKKVLVDFTGYGCVNCREMEQRIWTDPDVAQQIENEFILTSLYVDDKTPLPTRIEVTENGQTTVLRTVGDKWSYLQRLRFGVNAQPFYVILNGDGTMAAPPCTFTTNAQEFLDFLGQTK